MDRITLREHLQEATVKLTEFTKTLCFNNIAHKYKYQITPNVNKEDKHLSQIEVGVIKIWKQYQNKLLTADQVVDLLHHNDKVPVWINTTVYEVRQDLTIIDLLCSRRMRNDNQLYHQGKIMPFHLQVAMPPDHLKIEKDGKFDVNWKKYFDDKQKRESILMKIRKYCIKLNDGGRGN